MLLNLKMSSVFAPCRASWLWVVEATRSRATLPPKFETDVVPKDNPPAKNDWEVVVESKLPTVNCEVVAMMLVPSDDAVRIAPLAKDKEAVRVPEVVRGEPVMLKALGR